MARKIILSLILVLTSVFLALSSCLNVSAFDLTLNAKPIWNQASPTWQFCALGTQNTGTSGTNYGGCIVGGDITSYYWQTSELDAYHYGINGGVANVRALRFYMPMTIYTNTFVETSITLNQIENGNASDIMIADLKVLSSYPLRVVSQNYEMLNQSTGVVHIILMAEGQVNANEPIILGSSFCNDISSCIQNVIWFREEKAQVRGNGLTLYAMEGSGADAIVNAINNNNSTAAVNSARDAIVGAINQQIAEQEQANQDANDRYEDEKQTMQDDVDGASDTADTMDSSGFSISNPFSGWLSLFSDDNCVDIPTLAGWIHSNETRICTPWQNHANIRPYTTPVVSVLSITVVFGLIVHWLKGDSDVGLENT